MKKFQSLFSGNYFSKQGQLVSKKYTTKQRPEEVLRVYLNNKKAYLTHSMHEIQFSYTFIMIWPQLFKRWIVLSTG